jgi:hypothetical protein
MNTSVDEAKLTKSTVRSRTIHSFQRWVCTQLFFGAGKQQRWLVLMADKDRLSVFGSFLPAIDGCLSNVLFCIGYDSLRPPSPQSLYLASSRDFASSSKVANCQVPTVARTLSS